MVTSYWWVWCHTWIVNDRETRLHFSPFPSGSTTGKAKISSYLRVCLLTTTFPHLRSWRWCLPGLEPMISQQFNCREWTRLQHTRHWFSKQSLRCVNADFSTCTGSQSLLQQPINSQHLFEISYPIIKKQKETTPCSIYSWGRRYAYVKFNSAVKDPKSHNKYNRNSFAWNVKKSSNKHNV
jgi:hypothetical protein